MSKIINPNESPLAKLGARLSVNEAALEQVLMQLERVGIALNTLTRVLDEHLKDAGGLKAAIEAIGAAERAKAASASEDAPTPPKEPTDIGVA